MKRRIYKKWLKNPLNKRLIWKFCKPFPKTPPVAYIKWNNDIEGFTKEIERLEKKLFEESLVPKKAFF